MIHDCEHCMYAVPPMFPEAERLFTLAAEVFIESLYTSWGTRRFYSGS